DRIRMESDSSGFGMVGLNRPELGAHTQKGRFLVSDCSIGSITDGNVIETIPMVKQSYQSFQIESLGVRGNTPEPNNGKKTI
ncbi:hypothetical protein NDU88_007751, partial [Pleurodeles waltl]